MYQIFTIQIYYKKVIEQITIKRESIDNDRINKT